MELAGEESTAAALDELAPSLSGGRATLLLGVMADKEVRELVAALHRSRILADAAVVAVTVPDAPRALAGEELAAAWGGDEVSGRSSLPEALDEAVDLARVADGPLVVAGSLYLVGAVRAALVPGPMAVPAGSTSPGGCRGTG